MNGTSSDTSPHPKASQRRQDLSYADQQELLAFIEKRRWFEGKLEVRLTRDSASVGAVVHMR